MELLPVLWNEWVFFKRRFWQITSAALIGPVLYMIAFGWGMGRGVQVEGQPYMAFLIPGIIALTTMNSSYNAVAVQLNIHRLYDRSFQEYIIAPVRVISITAGKILAGALRGMYAGTVILLISLLFGSMVRVNVWFILIMFLNSLVFSALGFYAALVVQSHTDMNRFGTFILTPMVFLCGTFFSPDSIPGAIRYIIYILPLTHTSQGLRGISTGGGVNWIHIVVPAIYFLGLFLLGLRQCCRVEA
ncbi:MAG: Efflux ABC transporter, permease protein [Firmicutes bacterium]|nr:Efflux ABC transporter, permease protein [Bacillota bacterium]MDI6707192.1 ABC transporter permease [Bacillota bacterium]